MMAEQMEFRLRTKRSDAVMKKYAGSNVKDGMVNMLLTGPSRVVKPDGSLLAVYLPGAVKHLSEELWPEFSRIRVKTENRGQASGGPRTKQPGNATRTNAPPVTSALLGTIDMDRSGTKQTVCRLTSFTAKNVEAWPKLMPMFQAVAAELEANVPDRYANQVEQARRVQDDWIIAGTPFTTITVNNTYPTGIHTDRGDLDAGFSTLACLRRGAWSGGWITFPQYGIGADMQDGDLLLMDAHEWHGNTAIICDGCGESLRLYGHKCLDEDGAEPERVSIVSYFRTNVVECGTAEQEAAKRAAIRDAQNLKAIGLEYGEA
jgi:hypothetical protein